MTDDRNYREGKMRRAIGMPEEKKKILEAYNNSLEWKVQCWNCRGFVERKLSDIKGPCPHCGVELSKRP